MRLYEVADKIREITDREELPDDLGVILDGLELDLRSKVDQLCRVMADESARSKAYAAEAQRLKALADQANNKHERLKDYVHASLLRAGLNKLDTDIFKLWVQRNSRPSISVHEGAKIPTAYERIKIEFDNEKAYQDWKRGVPLPEAIHVEIGNHLRVK